MGSLYSDQATWLHRVPAACKLLLLAVLVGALLATNRLAPLLAGAGGALLLLASLGRPGAAARRLLRTVAIGALLVALGHSALGQPLAGLAQAARIVGTALPGVALSLSTRPADLLQVLEAVLNPLARIGVPVQRLGLALALMLRFVEQIFVGWQRLDDAHRARTGRPGGWRLLAPLLIQVLQSARRVADALQLRLGG
jgi:biotin transport system permease protein